jgi:SPP1 family predicted phage head-tail adaptor
MLRHRVEIQRRVESLDEYGQDTEAWLPVATVWAAVESLRGRELEATATRLAEASHKIRIRYRAGIQPTMRLVGQDGRIFDIQAVIDPDDRRRELHLLAREAV